MEETTAGLPCAESCVREAPVGWNGPVVRALGTEACGGEFPQLEEVVFAGAGGPAAECECSCGDPEGGACADSTTVRVYDLTTSSNSSGCNSLSETFTAPDDNYVDANDSGVRFRVAPRAVDTPPTCSPSFSEDIGEVSLTGELELCSGEPVDGDCMDEEVCLPSIGGGFVAGYCIWAEGVQDCPASSGYTAREVMFTSITDTRDCSACSCGAAQDVACGGTISYTVTYNPTGGAVITNDPAETVSANDSCSTVRSPNSGVETGNVVYGFAGGVQDLEPSASSCAAEGGVSVGSVAGAGELTGCCVP